tara:strand:- start:1451 stop:2185 length:735 start_codon:yes stop_codon:yes gene_type:complete
MDLQLDGKRAVLTGSTSGIGWPARWRASGRKFRARRSTACRPICHWQLNAAGAVGMLDNNLGIFELKPFEQIGDNDWTRFFEVNVMSGVRLARHHQPVMKARGWGRTVFISSESGICPPAQMLHYGMNKSAQLSVSRGLAETCIDTGVTVNAARPGPKRTEGVGEFFTKLARDAGHTLVEAERDFFNYARPTSLLQHFIEPAEVAAMVTCVCSPRSAATKGAALHVEGGVVRSLIQLFNLRCFS